MIKHTPLGPVQPIAANRIIAGCLITFTNTHRWWQVLAVERNICVPDWSYLSTRVTFTTGDVVVFFADSPVWMR